MTFFVVLLVAVTSVFAAGTHLQFGGVVGFEKPFAAEDFEAGDMLDIGNYRFGYDLRGNLSIFNISTMAMFGKTSGSFVIDTNITTGFRFRLGPVELGAGIGPRFCFTTPDFMDFAVNGIHSTDFSTAVMTAPLIYKLTAGIVLANVTVGAVYTVDTPLAFGHFNAEDLIPDFRNGKLGVSLLLNLL